MNMQKYILYLVSVMSSIIPGSVCAKELPDDSFKIEVGGYAITRYDSTMSLTNIAAGVGLSISPQDTLGFKTEQTVFRVDGHYRFNRRHRINFTWYNIDVNAYKVLAEDIEWIDNDGNTITIPTGARVSSSLNYDIYKLGYLWSFYNSDKVELSAGAGVHVSRVAVNLTADTTSSGIDAKSVKSTFPLPVLSFAINYRVTPRLHWYMKSEYFTLSFNEWYGLYSDTNLGMEYRLFDNFGLGAAIGGNSLKLIHETSNEKFKYENRITGVMLYLSGYF